MMKMTKIGHFWPKIDPQHPKNPKVLKNPFRGIQVCTKFKLFARKTKSVCCGFRRQIVFKNPKIEHLHRGDPIQNNFLRKNWKIWDFLIPRKGINTTKIEWKGMLTHCFAQICHNWMILGRKKSFRPDFDPEISIFIVAYPPSVHHCVAFFRRGHVRSWLRVLLWSWLQFRVFQNNTDCVIAIDF